MLHLRHSFSVPANGGTDPRLLERCAAGEHGMIDRRGVCCHCDTKVLSRLAPVENVPTGGPDYAWRPDRVDKLEPAQPLATSALNEMLARQAINCSDSAGSSTT